MKTSTRGAAVLLSQRVGAVVLFLLLWQVLVWTGMFPSAVPGVIDVGIAIGGLVVSPTFWIALGQTIGAAVSGWAIAAVVGIVLGLLIGSLPFLDRATAIVVEFGRAFPIIALLPVVVLILGANVRMEIFMVALSCLWPVLVQSIYGSRRQEAAVTDTVRVFRIPPLLRFRRVLLPAALPFVTTGLRIASSIAILVAVGIEVLSQTPGIGRQITLAQEAQRWDLAFAYLFFAGLVGWCIATGLQAAEARGLRWSRRRED